METISKPRSIYQTTQRTARCGSRKKAAAPQRTCREPAPDFLRHTFLPLYVDEGIIIPDAELLEQQYLESLALVQTVYPFGQVDISCKPFPYNLLLSAWDAERKLKRLCPEQIFHVDGGGHIILDSGQRLPNSLKLYYIPVQPLFMLTKSKVRQDKRTAQLILSVFAYLYHKAGVPFYQSGSSFIKWQYDMILESLVEDYTYESFEGFDEQMNEIRAVFGYGAIMQKKIAHESHLLQYYKRLQDYKPCSDWEKEAHQLARQFYALWQSYPDTHIFSHIIPIDDRDNDIIWVEQYVSFVATNDGALNDELIKLVNSRFEQCSDIDEAGAFTTFGKDGKITHDDFDYDSSLFKLIDQLCTLLNDRL